MCISNIYIVSVRIYISPEMPDILKDISVQVDYGQGLMVESPTLYTGKWSFRRPTTILYFIATWKLLQILLLDDFFTDISRCNLYLTQCAILRCIVRSWLIGAGRLCSSKQSKDTGCLFTWILPGSLCSGSWPLPLGSDSHFVLIICEQGVCNVGFLWKVLGRICVMPPKLPTVLACGNLPCLCPSSYGILSSVAQVTFSFLFTDTNLGPP